MIEPVFVGLLAAAFAFVYAQLLGWARYLHDAYKNAVKNEEYVEALLEYVGETYGEPFVGDEGEARFLAFYTVMIGKVLAIPSGPLAWYFVSLCILVAGYWFAIDLVVAVGLVLLLFALFLCVVRLRFWLRAVEMEYESVAKWVYDECMKGLKKEG